jgi:hypothetical protein
MTRDEFTAEAIRTAAEIVRREGSALAKAVYGMDAAEVDADSTLLGTAIAKALIEAYDAGREADR